MDKTKDTSTAPANRRFRVKTGTHHENGVEYFKDGPAGDIVETTTDLNAKLDPFKEKFEPLD